MRLNATTAAIVCTFITLTNTVLADATQFVPGKEGFNQSVKPFLTKYCADCHGPDVQEGKLALHALEFANFTADDLELWGKVGEKLTFIKMPPRDAPQPSAAERARLTDWVEGQLRAAGREPDWKHKLVLPDYGNLLDHRSLFETMEPSAAFTPARLWKKSPYIFDSLRTRGMGFIRQKNQRNPSELANVKQPFTMEDRAGIKDYAAIMFADSATLETLLRNAEAIVDKHLEEALAILDPPTGELPKDAQGRPIAPRYFPTSAEFRQIVLSTKPPSDSEIDAAVRKMYALVIEQEPTTEEFAKYRDLLRKWAATAGNAEGLRMMLIAIAISPPAVYRQEVGVGPFDKHGRQMLSPANLAFAISYALTDEQPDAVLLEAARSGQLKTREDVSREVARLWDDPLLQKPRILRFFQEFFGYHRAPQVFKDDARFGRGYDRPKVPKWLVDDADTLVRYIVRGDKNVLAELLTTEKFFVGHNGDNKRAREIANAQASFFEYLKDKDWKSFPYNIPQEHMSHLRPLDSMFSHLNGPMVHTWMPYLLACNKQGVSPMPLTQRREFLAAYNLDETTFDYPVEQPFSLAPGKRVGILMHPAWLIAHSLNLDNDPVRRGKWIRERLLADTVPDLPITVDARIPDEPDQTLRHRFRVTEAKECWRCHAQMNPLGMPFESFDDFGRFREVEHLQSKGQTAPVDSRGALAGTEDEALDGPVANPIELVQRLAKSERVRQSFVRHAFRYWMGRNEMLSDAPTLISADRAYVTSGGSFRALVLSLLTSDSFLYRKSIGVEHE